jgi:hypothetical protein
MNAVKRCSMFAFVFFLSALIVPHESYAWPWSKPKPPGQKAAKPAPKKKAREKSYRYIGEHDLNGDGAVDNRDRLIWVERHRNSFQNTLVSKENEDLLEAMDANKDGNVDALELKRFYDKYDLNKNGVLENEEIKAAIEQ